MANHVALEISNRETCINPKQRPRIFLDMEAILKIFVQRKQLQGVPMTKDGVCITVMKVYERLQKINFYDDNGARKYDDEMLTQEYVDVILQTYPQSTITEITDPDDPDYENTEIEDTNET